MELKKHKLRIRGILNNSITSMLFELLEKKGVKTHFYQKGKNR